VRVLVVEDDRRIARLLKQGLAESGYCVATAFDGEDGYLDARYNHYDLIILDLMLPSMDGLAIARRLRTEGVRTPILMLTALDQEDSVVVGLDAGADDYLTKPFRLGELLARVRALIRRESLTRAGVMHVGDLVVDTTTRRVFLGGNEVELSTREYSLLEYLVHHTGQIVTRELLTENVWSDADIESNVIDVYVGYLRQKIDADSHPSLIRTVRGLGYTIRPST
jgi:DNA-binding response OmpR family regulator